jgi:anti-sigma factor RsiW
LKTDNAFSCSRFEEHLRAYIDDELPVNINSAFLAHADTCSGCARELREMQYTRKLLGMLPRRAVSPEFDFKMKLRIRQEYQRSQNPWYSVKVAFRENLSKFVVIPAAAAAMIAALAVYHTMTMPNALPVAPLQVQLEGRGVELVGDENASTNEEVNYVLEKVSPYDIQQGSFSPVMSGSGNDAAGSQDITLISF